MKIDIHEKAYRVLQEIHRLANEHEQVIIERDWGGNTATLAIKGVTHYHAGFLHNDERDSFPHLVDDLYSFLLCSNKGGK